MSYNAGFPVTYPQQSYYNPYSVYNTTLPSVQQMQNQSMQQMPQPEQTVQHDSGITWVQGEAAARAYPVIYGTSALLMDSENSVFYIKTVDKSGRPYPLRIFDYTERPYTANMQDKLTQPVVVESKEIDMSNYVKKDELNDLIKSILNENNQNKTTSAPETYALQVIPDKK